MSDQFSDTDLILNPDGSVYHLHVRGEQIAENVIIVGDQDRVSRISRHFDQIELTLQNREFVTHTGRVGNTGITVMSTGIGTDNIDIVMNELDAAININPSTRKLNETQRKLNVIRVGTSGTLQEDIPIGTQVISEFGLGLDGLLHFYNYQSDALEIELSTKIIQHLGWNAEVATPYICKASTGLFNKLRSGMVAGITVSTPGFYGPQGRMVKLGPKNRNILTELSSFYHQNHRITNFEMETSALYGLSNMLGHESCTCCAIIANRIRKEFSKDYQKDVDNLIETVIERIT